MSDSTDWIVVITFAIWAFWSQGGWYRVDCSLGVSRACELIAAEEEYKP